jgi:hypothetical protein
MIADCFDVDTVVYKPHVAAMEASSSPSSLWPGTKEFHLATAHPHGATVAWSGV